VLGVDGTIVLDGFGLGTLSTDLGDLVLRGVIDLVDKIIDDIDEDDIVTRLVEELGNEAVVACQ
jgi:hypothetical protein